MYLLNLEDKVNLIMSEKRKEEGDGDTDEKRMGKKIERGKKEESQRQ